ncbi:MAG: hypothetical protein D6729_01290 [Deltaproteobacteria bacterium]|nr:MAG: hypothetical protein D6729_01290 [Deltaproteobacteria bacterium]
MPTRGVVPLRTAAPTRTVPSLRAAVLALLVLAPLPLVAAPRAPGPSDAPHLPPPLAPWKDWVLDGQEEALKCPLEVRPSGLVRRCAWPARLTLDLGAGGGRFEQRWVLQVERFVPLPGSRAHPPREVQVDGRRAVVLEHKGRLGVRLPPGRHQVQGVFAWPELPEQLEIPPETGLLSLRLDGRPVPFPRREADGRLYLKAPAQAGRAEDRIVLQVFRHIVDDVPMRVVTRLDLRVSGKNRELTVGPVLLPEAIPVRLDAPIPARLESDGRLTLQVRPGTWPIEIESRFPGPVSQIASPRRPDPWPKSEVWVFEARPNLRVVNVRGAPAVDPGQTKLPEAWRSLPAYLVEAGATLAFEVLQRGAAEVAPDQLRLTRTLWLDFDGGGLTARDEIQGTLHSGDRLVASRRLKLGHVTVDGREQLVTVLGEDGAPGVEVRRRQLDVVAESRIEGPAGDLPAVGWDHDVQSLRATLHLPPGWRLFHVAGSDRVDPESEVWLASWSLLDLFLLLVVALGFARLYGWGFGALALVTLALVLPEDGPAWIWVFVLVFEALHRVVPAGHVRRAVAWLRGTVWVVLVILAVAFAVRQVRVGLYPVLEWPEREVAGEGLGVSGVPTISDLVGASADALAGEEVRALEDESAPSPKRKGERWRGMAQQAARLSSSDSKLSYEVDPKASVQTGPGLPKWSWRTLSLTFQGPVSKAQRLSLYLLSPAVNHALAWLRTLLLGVWVLGVLGVLQRRRDDAAPGGGGGPKATAAAALLAGAVLLFPAGAAALPTGDAAGPNSSSGSADASAATVAGPLTPPADLLAELRARLTRPPECAPECAAVTRLEVEAQGEILLLRLEVGAAAPVALPLPGDPAAWSPEEVYVNDWPAAALARDASGRLWVQIEAGVQHLLLRGRLPPRETIEVPLPLRPLWARVDATGWQVDGVHEDGTTDASLLLTRVRSEGEQAPLEAGALPPFLRVERHLKLGLDWSVTTTVERLSPVGSAVIAEVPLLPGERPTTDGLRVRDGAVQVSLAPGQVRFAWESVLEEREQLELVAPKTTEWVELWLLDVSPVWHVRAEGIPPVHTAAEEALRRWQPWPGEAVSLRIQRPAPAEGRQLTIDESHLSVHPGRRVTDSSLEFVVRASRGGAHRVVLPEGAEVQEVTIDGTSQPVQKEGRTVTLPIHPGRQRLRIEWREPRPVTGWYRSSPVDLGAPSVNATLEVTPSDGRWLLAVAGPVAGPAVLFWSQLAVILLVAWVLGRVRWVPLRWYQWFFLGIGFTQSSIWVAAFVAGFFLFVGWREVRPDLSRNWFNLRQLLLAGWAVAVLVALVAAVSLGLLGDPEMQVAGNGSSASVLRWYADRSGATLPQATLVSVPIFVYRLAMLAWALWLAAALLSWARWAWDAFGRGGYWRRAPARPARPISAGGARGTAAPSEGDGPNARAAESGAGEGAPAPAAPPSDASDAGAGSGSAPPGAEVEAAEPEGAGRRNRGGAERTGAEAEGGGESDTDPSDGPR